MHGAGNPSADFGGGESSNWRIKVSVLFSMHMMMHLTIMSDFGVEENI